MCNVQWSCATLLAQHDTCYGICQDFRTVRISGSTGVGTSASITFTPSTKPSDRNYCDSNMEANAQKQCDNEYVNDPLLSFCSCRSFVMWWMYFTVFRRKNHWIIIILWEWRVTTLLRFINLQFKSGDVNRGRWHSANIVWRKLIWLKTRSQPNPFAWITIVLKWLDFHCLFI